MMTIYKITNKITGQLYIGQSVNIENRFSDYKALRVIGQHKIENSLLLYGIDNHKFEIVCSCIDEVADKLEILEILLKRNVLVGG